MSSRSADAAAVVLVAGAFAACATAIPLIRVSANIATRTLLAKFLVTFLGMVVAPLFFLRRFVASGLGLGFGHELPLFGLAIPLATLVVDPGRSVDPNFAAGLGCCDIRTGSRCNRSRSRLLRPHHVGARSWCRS